MEEMPETNEPQRQSNNRTLSIVAIVLSIGALFVSVLEVSAIRDEQRLQAWPYVEVVQSYNAEGYSILATNKGIGPARIRSLEMFFDGKPNNDLEAVIEATVGKEDAFSYDLYRTSDIARSVMSPEQVSTLFAVPWEPRTRRLSTIWGEKLDLRVCYCSVYDDCWESTLRNREPVAVKQCDAD